MIINKDLVGVITISLLATHVSLSAVSEPPDADKREYAGDMERIKVFEKSLKPELANSLDEFRKVADEIKGQWSQKNVELNAHLILEICRTLSSFNFKDHRRHDLAREYALSVLDKPEGVSLQMELELTGHVMTSVGIPGSPSGDEFAQRRKKDAEVRLHAWKHLLDCVDPNWDPNEVLLSPNGVGASMGLPSGIAPEGVKDPKLRGEYEAALETNRQKIERHTEQRRLHDWLTRFPPSRENT